MTIRFIILLLLISFAAQAQETPRKPSYLQKEPSSPSSEFKYSFSEGTVNGKALRTESIHTGKVTITTGSLGSKPVNTSTIKLGDMELTTGTVGNEAVEVITIGSEKD